MTDTKGQLTEGMDMIEDTIEATIDKLIHTMSSLQDMIEAMKGHQKEDRKELNKVRLQQLRPEIGELDMLLKRPSFDGYKIDR